MARFCPLFSSSKGNSIVVGGADSFVLIDAGVSAARICKALCERGLELSRLAAVFITHEHSDHVSGLQTLISKTHVPVYATQGTISELRRSTTILDNAEVRVCPAEGVDIDGMHIYSFRTMHDVAESCGYSVTTPDGRRAVIATDTGCVTDAMRQALIGCDLAYIESNHDVGMLTSCSYPQFLKQRILSPKGHLSNECCAAELPYLAQNGTSRFILAHLSQDSNRPELARSCASAALSALRLREGVDYLLEVCPSDGMPLMLF